MNSRFKYYNFFLLGLIVFSFGGIVHDSGLISGNFVQDFDSEVSISNNIAISLSQNLSSGVIFDEVHLLPANSVNASHNYDYLGGGSGYFLLVSDDSNSAVDLCVRAGDDLRSSGGDVIGIGNETYSTSLQNNLTHPTFNETSFTFDYVWVDESIPIGNNMSFRFWLDVPSGQASGVYNNTLFFKGNVAGVPC